MQQDISNETSIGISFYFHSEQLDFDEISKKLSIMPTNTVKKSQIKCEDFAEDYWNFEKEKMPSDDIGNQVNLLMDVFLPKSSAILDILSNQNTKIGITIIIDVYDGKFPLLVLTGEQVAFIGQFHCQLAFDIMYFENEENGRRVETIS